MTGCTDYGVMQSGASVHASDFILATFAATCAMPLIHTSPFARGSLLESYPDDPAGGFATATGRS